MRRVPIRFCITRRIREKNAQYVQRFQTLDGMKQGVDPRYDQYLSDKRLEDTWEAFDQRVERAFQQCWRAHKAEIWNAYKRRVRNSRQDGGQGGQNKITPELILEIEKILEDRKHWLRNVWAQVDSDYRSGDDIRSNRAEQDIQAALRNEGSPFMAWAYETKYSLRFADPIERDAQLQQLSSNDFPDLLDEEVDRYVQRKTSMLEVEEKVKKEFGLAGKQHWDLLQKEKDAEYIEKLDRAVAIYENLKKDENEALESHKLKNTQMLMARISAARVRLRSALEHEDHRREMDQAHHEMQKERDAAASRRRKDLLLEAAHMRQEGHSSVAIQQAIQRKTLQDIVNRQNQFAQNQVSNLMEHRAKMHNMMRTMQQAVSEREGIDAMDTYGKKVMEDVAKGDNASSAPSLLERAMEMARREAKNRSEVPFLTKKAMWNLLHERKEDTPEYVIHQARKDAEKTYSAVYRKTKANRLRNKQYRDHMTMHDMQGQESKIFHSPFREEAVVGWGMNSFAVHNLDDSGSRQYTQDMTGFHVMDPRSGDVDKKSEKRHGEGPIFRKEPLYKEQTSDIGTTL